MNFYLLRKDNNYLKLGARFGLCDYPRSTNFAVFSWTNCLKKMNIEADIVFFGNSITRGSDFQRSFPDKKIVNLGYTGDGFPNMLERIEMVRCCYPKKIFVMACINSIKRWSDDEFYGYYGQLLDSMLTIVPADSLFAESILPVNQDMPFAKEIGSNANEVIPVKNAIIRRLCEEKGCTYVDLYSAYNEQGTLPARLTIDGVHLKPYAYKKWEGIIAPMIYN